MDLLKEMEIITVAGVVCSAIHFCEQSQKSLEEVGRDLKTHFVSHISTNSSHNCEQGKIYCNTGLCLRNP